MFNFSKKLSTKKRAVVVTATMVTLISVAVGSARYLRNAEDITPEESEAETWNIDDLVIEYGKVETVFDHSTQSCEDDDFSDAPARAFVDNTGKLQLISAHYHTRRFIGPNLDDITHECSVVLNSHNNADPTYNNDKEWLHSVYYLDGIVHGLIHNEFQGWTHGPGCNSDLFSCWYNSITYAWSTDNGVSYQHKTAPTHTIVSYSSNYDPNNTSGPVGFFEPTNIFKKDGFYYFYANHHEQNGSWGSCLFRSSSLGPDVTWSYWNGNGFSPVVGQKAPDCTPIPAFTVGYVSITYNEYLEKYLALRCQWGTCMFSISDDLFKWEHYREIADGNMCMYASFIQPGEETTNFENTGRSPWIYFMSCPNCGNCDNNRDTKRLRIRFSKPNDVGKNEQLDLQFSERSGTKSLDSSFYGNNAILSGSYSFQNESESRYYVHLNDNAVGSIAHNPSLNASNSLSIRAKIRLSQLPSAGNYARILEKTESEPTIKRNYGFFVTPEGKLHFSINDGTGYEGTVSKGILSANQWYDVAVTFNDATDRVSYYLNGTFDSTTTITKSLASSQNSGPVLIGGNVFSGNIDSVTLYNYEIFQPSCSCSGKECGDDGCGGSCGTCTSPLVCNTTMGKCESSCTSSCTGKECGSDGCGGSCGTCTAPKTCNASGQCVCTRNCTGKECGDDGCGGSCGTCTSPLVCNTTTGKCESSCTPNCTGKECGDDGCGGSCGSCTSPKICNPFNQCTCTPNCTGKICGDSDGCGGICTSCPTGKTCNTNTKTCTPTCVPTCTGKECGSDGCGGSCGTCTSPKTCDASGKCVCTPSCDGKICGDSNGCGGICTSCPSGKTCNTSSWTCQTTCVPSCQNRECGSNGCGGSCGTCTSPNVCTKDYQCKTPASLPGDLNKDSKVSVTDYSLFIRDYFAFQKGDGLNERSDFNRDGKITVSDYARFIGYYLEFLKS